MDVVSDAIAAVRTGRPSANRLRVDGSWCVRLEAYEGAGFHVVLTGGCWLLPDGGAPLTLRPGDAVLLPHGAGHLLADAPVDPAGAARAVSFEALSELPSAAADADAPVELLCGKYRLDRSHTHPLLAELPDVVHLPHDDTSHPELRAAIDLLGREVVTARPGSCAAVPSLLDLLLVYLIRAWTTSPGGRGTARWPRALADPVVTEALRLLHGERPTPGPPTAWRHARASPGRPSTAASPPWWAALR